MLNAECLFEDEFLEYFKSLSQMEIILLSKYIEDLSLYGEYEQEWYCKFNEYILSLSEEDKIKIGKLKDSINLKI